MEKIQLPWKSTKDGLPQKTGNHNYEHVHCLVVKGGWFEMLSWNCEEQCWDDDEGDDYECDAMAVDYYIPLSEIQMPQP